MRRTEVLEARVQLTVDFGDAPDLGFGTGSADYETLAENGGPSHTIVSGLHLGASVDGDSGALQNSRANADDVDAAAPDDEDGVLNPLDLQATAGTQAVVTLLATNTSGSPATLSGWIDFNANGVFDNATERTQIAVPDGAADGRFTLTFPVIPDGLAGRTYARFRLSTDRAAEDSTGAASDGEVEDYPFVITNVSSGFHVSTVEITAPGTDDGTKWPYFGHAASSLGDLDGDGVNDLAVGAYWAAGGGRQRGAVYVLFLNADGSVKQSVEVSSRSVNGPVLADGAYFGLSVAALGDLDVDGVVDLAVGSYGDGGSGGNLRGVVHVLFLNADGSVKRTVQIDESTPNGPVLDDNDHFGSSVASLGDLDGDGVVDLSVGAYGDDAGSPGAGTLHVLLLNTDGSVKQTMEINTTTPNGPSLSHGDHFGSSVASLGDLDGDGVSDIAVGAVGIDDDLAGFSTRHGAVFVLLLHADGTVKRTTQISPSTPNGPKLSSYDEFGSALASVSDLDGDGVTDLAVGAAWAGDGGMERGVVHLLLLNSDGSVKRTIEINSTTPGGPWQGNYSHVGSSVVSLGDINGDGLTDLAAGASYRDAVHILFLGPPPDYGDAPDLGPGTGPGDYETLPENGGPSHTIVDDLYLGFSVDRDDGVSDFYERIGAEGIVSTVTFGLTNTTGRVATLSGWIDFNGDGVFDNDSERAQAEVPDGIYTTTSVHEVHVTLTFPATPIGSAGTTYARFRLSTDPAAQNPNGAASDGEVEDYVFTINTPSSDRDEHYVRIASGRNGGPLLPRRSGLGSSVALIGDVDGDGVDDLAVGAYGDITDGRASSNRGAIHVLMMNTDGSVRDSTKITNNFGGGPPLSGWDEFGIAVAGLGDLNGDGIPDLAIGARGDDTGGDRRGAVYVVFLSDDGSAKSYTKIASETGGGPLLTDVGWFGGSIANLGDVDGDGVTDLAVGAQNDEAEGPFVNSFTGATYVLFMNPDGSVKRSTKIADDVNGGSSFGVGDFFGASVAGLGDFDGDGVPDLVVGALGDRHSYESAGTLHVLFLEPDGGVKSAVKIGNGLNGGPEFEDVEHFAASVANLGDVDGDGVVDLAVGATAVDDLRGAVCVLLLNADGSVKSFRRITSVSGEGLPFEEQHWFGTSVAGVGDWNGDGVTDLAVGALGAWTGGWGTGRCICCFSPNRWKPEL
jgi:hypothetical protein